MEKDTTIAAVSTPLASGGIGIVRLSGKMAIQISEKIFRPNGRKGLRELVGYSGCLGKIVSGEEIVDEAIAFVYKSPKSYTGEDVVELSCHGGMWIVRKVLRLCLENGAFPAEPGEFTKRAYLNGKMDLLQAEAVMEIIQAGGDAALQSAISSKDGVLSREIGAFIETLLAQSAHLAAWADYPDEDIENIDIGSLKETLINCAQRLKNLLKTYDQGKILHEGINVAIVGKPNVGKSTLMNLLSGQQRSIVTEIPGTTRDVVEDTVRVGEVTLHLSDTAGIRQTDDIIEKIGVERSKQILASSQLILAVFDNSQRIESTDNDLIEYLSNKPVIAVINKIDIPSRLDMSYIMERFERIVTISAATGQGRDELASKILECAGIRKIDPSAAMVVSERQRMALSETMNSVNEAIRALEVGITFDAVNVEIDSALDCLLVLRGERASDRVIDEVFSRFCVGK